MTDEEEEVGAVLEGEEDGLVAETELLAGHIYYTCCWWAGSRTSGWTCPHIPCRGTWSSNLDQDRGSNLLVVRLLDLDPHSRSHDDTDVEDEDLALV